jgi:hypothetical protein
LKEGRAAALYLRFPYDPSLLPSPFSLRVPSIFLYDKLKEFTKKMIVGFFIRGSLFCHKGIFFMTN